MADNGSIADALHIPNLAGELPDKWTWKRLDKACLDVIDCPHSTPKIAPIGPLMVRSQDIRSGVFLVDQAARVSEESYQERIRRAEPTYGDLVYSREGTYFGIAAEVPKDTRVCLGQRMVLFRPDPKQIQFRYLKYWLNSPVLQSHIHGHRDGTVAERLNLPTIRALPVPVAPIHVQERIADILGTLDDKIELNRRMNETLEAMARRLFRSWFVDFDPVHAKARLRSMHPKLTGADLSRRALPNMAPEIAELFPDSFEDSTLGPIPKGWKTRPLYDIANFVNGAAFKTSDFCDPSIGKPVIKIAELKSGIDPQTKFSQKDVGPNREIRCGDMLYSWSGSPDTSLATFRWTGRDGLLNQHIFKIITENRPDEIFAYYQLNDLRDTLVEIARNKQTTGLGHVTVADMKRLHVIHPVPEILEGFADNTGPMYDQSFNLSVDSLTVQKTRDKLLPRLLSGELSVAQEVT